MTEKQQVPAKKFQLGIRSTFLLFVGFVLCSLMLAVVYQSGSYQREALLSERQKLVFAHLKSLTSIAVERLTTKDVSLELVMFDFIDGILHDEKDIVDVFVQEPSGRILLHNNQSNNGKILADSLTFWYLSQKKPGMKKIREHKENLLEFYAPIFHPAEGSLIGLARIRMRTDSIERDIHKTTVAMGRIFAVSFILAMLFTFFIVYRITKPIHILSSRVQEFGHRFDPEKPETADFEIDFQANNELGDLRDTFNQMTRDLKATIEAKIKLHQAATTDGLTGLLNKRQFSEDLESILQRSKDQKKSVTMMLLDMDSFKLLNDTFGHAMGDKALQDVASAIHGRIRQRDRAYRIGGDEFAILLWDANRNTGVELGNRIAQCYNENKEIKNMTDISCGVVEYESNEDSEEFFHRADDEMYRIKREKKSQR